jgi:cytochrome c2
MIAWGQVWTLENIQAFILDPGKTIPGNKMDYEGARDAATAKAIAEYVATLKPQN